MMGALICDRCPALAVVFRLDPGDAPAACFCMRCAVQQGWPWLASEAASKGKRKAGAKR